MSTPTSSTTDHDERPDTDSSDAPDSPASPDASDASDASDPSAPADPDLPATAAGDGEVPDGPDAPAGERYGPNWLVVALLAVIGLALAAGGFAMGTLVGDDGEDAASFRPGENSVDVGFARDMTTHHNQAVEMAGIVRDRSTDPDVRLLAFDIETGQLSQVGTMQGWLQLWGRGPNGTDAPMAWMGGVPGHDHGGGEDAGPGAPMPGMATSREMDQLRAARGKDLDVQFLRLMIRHHLGGVPMARYTEENAQEPVVRNLAEKIVVAQSNEVVTMEKMLRERGGTPLPPPS